MSTVTRAQTNSSIGKTSSMFLHRHNTSMALQFPDSLGLWKSWGRSSRCNLKLPLHVAQLVLLSFRDADKGDNDISCHRVLIKIFDSIGQITWCTKTCQDVGSTWIPQGAKSLYMLEVGMLSHLLRRENVLVLWDFAFDKNASSTKK